MNIKLILSNSSFNHSLQNLGYSLMRLLYILISNDFKLFVLMEKYSLNPSTKNLLNCNHSPNEIYNRSKF